MHITPSEITTLDKRLQLEKALSPMLLTLLGMMVVLHPAIKVFDAVSIIALQLSRES